MSNSEKLSSVTQLIALSRVVLRHEFFDVKALRLPDEALFRIKPHKRCVIVVPKKVGSAPVRNRCRRRFKGLLRESPLAQFPGILIFFIRKSVADLPAEQLRAILVKLEKRVRV